MANIANILDPCEEQAAIRYNRGRSFSERRTMMYQKLVGAKADGIIGPKTVQHVAVWQSKRLLAADGKIGPNTQKAMDQAIAAQVVDANKPSQQPHTPGEPSVWGDISKWQKDINYNAMKVFGFEGVIVKLSHGVNAEDPWAERHGHGLSDIGLGLSYYHWATPGTNDGRTRVRCLKEDAKEEAMDYLTRWHSDRIAPATHIPALDFEENALKMNRKDMTIWCDAFLQVMIDQGFPQVFVYSNPSFFNRNLEIGCLAASMPLWLSHYGTSTPKIPDVWKHLYDKYPPMWQYTSELKMPGYRGDLDSNSCHEGMDHFRLAS